MKKSVYVLCNILFLSFVYGELINCNPDRNGVKWFAGGVNPQIIKQQKNFDQIPKLTLPGFYKSRKEDLPYSVDNSLQRYFRPVFCQEGGSCSQASGIGYTYTYEQNFKRGTSANITDNQYPTHYTYNFLNRGDGNTGTGANDGWSIVASGGCPTVSDYGGLLWPSTDPETMFKLWMNGYNKYADGMNNRVLEQSYIPVGTPDGLNILKQWFNDHCDGSEAGGLAIFYGGVFYDFQRVQLPENSFCPNESVIIKWDKNVNHTMTFVGYNDSIRWDYNNDGKFTNHIDITRDGKVDMQDWEIGGLRMVNSWGDTWADNGKSWVMYRTLAQSLDDGGIFLNSVYVISVKESAVPDLKLKAKINYSERNDICIFAGIAKDTAAAFPEKTIKFPYFNYQGGDSIGLTGDGNVLELGLDLTPFYEYITIGGGAKIFLCVEQKIGEGGTGSIESFSIIDEKGIEFVSEQTNVTIFNDSTTYATVILPQDMNISATYLPSVIPDVGYFHTMEATNGTLPYIWNTVYEYTEQQNNNLYPADALIKLTMSSSDDGFANVDLPFSFPCFGKLYNSLTITTNGAITFSGVYEGVKTIEDVLITKTIAPCASDFKLMKKDIISYFANENYAVVKWKVSTASSGSGNGSSTITVSCDFAAKLYPDGKIEFFYGAFNNGITRVSGISNGSVESCIISNISYEVFPYGLKTSFITQPYPYGLELSSNGIFSGTLEPTDLTQWEVIFKVTDGKGFTDSRKLSLFKADPTAILTEPLNPVILENNTGYLLSWNQVNGATIYYVYRSTDPYRDFVRIGTSTTLSYQDDEVLPGNKYFYYITADNAYLIR